MTTTLAMRTINIQPRSPISENSPDFNIDEVPELESERIPSLKIKQQTLFPEEDDQNAQTKPNSSNARSLAQQEQIDLPSPRNQGGYTPNTGVLSDNGKEEGVALSEESPVEHFQPEPNVEALPPLDSSPVHGPSKSFLKLNLLRRQDSNPMVMQDFHQIESNLEGDGMNMYSQENDNTSPVFNAEKGTAGLSTSTLVPSKFAPDRMKKNSSQVTFLFKSPKQNMFKESFASPRSARDDMRSDDREAKRKWNKLSHVFKSIMMFSRHEVKNINDPAAIYDEISTFQLRQLNEKRNRAWDISKQDFARDAFQNIRRIEAFCDCATIGSIKHVSFMNELIEKDPKRYLLEPDDPAYLTNCKNSRGHTPLYIAAKHGNFEVIKLLFKWKVNYLIPSKISLVEKKTELPLEAAARWGHDEVVKYLLENCKFEVSYVKKCLQITESNNIKSIIREYLKRPDVKKGWRIVTKFFG